MEFLPSMAIFINLLNQSINSNWGRKHNFNFTKNSTIDNLLNKKILENNDNAHLVEQYVPFELFALKGY
jgi:hypothetical protein